MCGRFLTPDEAAFERHWQISAPADYFQSYNVAPSQSVAVVRHDDQQAPTVTMMTWGFQPGWAKRAWINARSETVFESRAFAPAAKKHRCVITAVGWYEWQGSQTPKQPYVFHRDGFMPFGFAGIWTARETDEGWMNSFAILTQPAAATLAHIHNRMPVVLAPEHYSTWMSTATSTAIARDVLTESIGGISAFPVSRYVNKPSNNDAECIRPLAHLES